MTTASREQERNFLWSSEVGHKPDGARQETPDPALRQTLSGLLKCDAFTACLSLPHRSIVAWQSELFSAVETGTDRDRAKEASIDDGNEKVSTHARLLKTHARATRRGPVVFHAAPQPGLTFWSADASLNWHIPDLTVLQRPLSSGGASSNIFQLEELRSQFSSAEHPNNCRTTYGNASNLVFSFPSSYSGPGGEEGP